MIWKARPVHLAIHLHRSPRLVNLKNDTTEGWALSLLDSNTVTSIKSRVFPVLRIEEVNRRYTILNSPKKDRCQFSGDTEGDTKLRHVKVKMYVV